jgi:HEAT repeat protein
VLPRTQAESPLGKSVAPISVAPSTGLESPTAKQSLAPATPAESPSAKKTSLPPRREPPKPPVRQPRGDTVRTVISGITPEPPPKKVSTPPQGTPKRLDPDVSGEPQPFPLTRRTPRPPVQHSEEAAEDGWAPPLEPEASFGSVSKPPPRRARTAPGLGVEPSSRPAPSSKRDGNRRLELVEQAGDVEPRREDTSIEVSETVELDDDLVDALAREEEAPLAPSSRSVAYGPRRLRPRQSAKELALPSVIIDLESECTDLLERLFAGDAEAGETLVQIGEPAVSVLVSRFPGPITVDPRRVSAESARASESGPLLRVIARIGPAAIPFLVVRTADADPEVRAWSTRLLGEMPSMESARATARRFLDGDESVRRAALAAGRMLQSDDESRAALRDGLAQLAADPAQSEDARLGAIEALADVRDPRAVPRLIPLLGDRNAEIAKLVHWALSVLARCDLGRDPKAWHEWWRENGVRHRIEWLIDALMNDSAEIRRAAGDELKVLTREYFGYYDDLPKRERAKAQKKYREWWDTKGKARFP